MKKIILVAPSSGYWGNSRNAEKARCNPNDRFKNTAIVNFLLLWLCWRARLDDRIIFDPLLELVTYDVFHEMTTHNVEESDIE